MEEQKFEPYQKVLARFRKGEPWIAVLYSHKGECGHLCGCYYYENCIPYEGNEHLVGTTDDPKPKWEPKRGDLVAVRDRDKDVWRARRFKRWTTKETPVCFDDWAEDDEELWKYCEPARKHFNIPDEE